MSGLFKWPMRGLRVYVNESNPHYTKNTERFSLQTVHMKATGNIRSGQGICFKDLEVV